MVSKSKMGGYIALLVGVAGLLTHPEILGLLPEKWALSLGGVGVILQAVTRSILPAKEGD